MIHPGLRTLVAVATVANVLFAADNFPGTWKRADISQTEVWQPTPEGYKITGTRRAQNGNSITSTREIILDGKEHPNEGPGPKIFARLRLTYTRVDANTLTMHGRDAESTAGSFDGKWAVSSDGKTMTYTYQATGANGRPVSQTSTYTKQ